MKDKITLSIISNKQDNSDFWTAKNEYLLKDIVPYTDLGSPLTEEDKEYFLSNEYYNLIENRCQRTVDRFYKVFFELDGKRIGFGIYGTYLSEDGKCFVLDFCIFPELRDRGLGSKCFEMVKGRAINEGAVFFELSTHCKRSKRFWERQGFVYNGFDEHGSILLILPPKDMEVSYEALSEDDIWQIFRLENGYRAETDKLFLTEEQQGRLEEAILCGKIRFYVVKQSTRVIGMCSLSIVFSTLSCEYCGTLEDFYIEPVFRKKGYAKSLLGYVQKSCREDVELCLISIE